MRPTDLPRDPIGVHAAAARLGVTHWTIRNWIKAARLPAWRLPGKTGRLIVSAADVTALAAPVEPSCGRRPEPTAYRESVRAETRATLKRMGLWKDEYA